MDESLSRPLPRPLRSTRTVAAELRAMERFPVGFEPRAMVRFPVGFKPCAMVRFTVQASDALHGVDDTRPASGQLAVFGRMQLRFSRW